MVLIHYFLVFTAIYILMGWSIYLPYKIGHLHFLPISIMAVCAYFAGIAYRDWNWNFFSILFISILIGFLVSYAIAKLVGNAPSFSVVIVGLTFIFIVKTIIENCSYLGGSIGFFNIPSINYLLFWAYLILLIVGYLVFRVENSHLARKAVVMFEDRTLAVAIGIRGEKLVEFYHSFSGIIAGLAGTLYALLIGGLSVDFFGFTMVGTLMAILFVGGYSTMWGIILTAPLLGGIPIFLPNVLIIWKQVIYGVLLIIMIIFQPDGLINRKQVSNWKSILKNRII